MLLRLIFKLNVTLKIIGLWKKTLKLKWAWIVFEHQLFHVDFILTGSWISKTDTKQSQDQYTEKQMVNQYKILTIVWKSTYCCIFSKSGEQLWKKVESVLRIFETVQVISE